MILPIRNSSTKKKLLVRVMNLYLADLSACALITFLFYFFFIIEWSDFHFSNPQMGGNTIDELLSRGDSEAFLQQGDSINGKSVVKFSFLPFDS